MKHYPWREHCRPKTRSPPPPDVCPFFPCTAAVRAVMHNVLLILATSRCAMATLLVQMSEASPLVSIKQALQQIKVSQRSALFCKKESIVSVWIFVVIPVFLRVLLQGDTCGTFVMSMVMSVLCFVKWKICVNSSSLFFVSLSLLWVHVKTDQYAATNFFIVFGCC